MSFHPDIVSLEPFTPHPLPDLVAMYAFPEGAMPDTAYDKLCAQYQAASDVKVERITYLSDNLNITGLMATPPGKIKGIVLYNRGGSGNYGILTVHAIMRQFVPLARAGYLVIGSNYRGNDGGDGKDEFGGRDVDDALKLHTIATHHPQAKGAKTFLIGHSRGGMMSFIMLKRGFKPQALVALAPVCELSEWNAEGSRMRERVYKGFIPNFLDHEEKSLRERSVLYWQEAITTPTLIMHGTKDEAVPHKQSIALSLILKPSHAHELVLYEGGNHALTRHWDNVMERTLDWFASHA